MTLDFNALGLPSNTALTNQLAAQGVTFSDAFYGATGQFGGAIFSTPAVYNFTELLLQRDSLVIQFGDAVQGAAFNIATFEGNTVFQAFLGTTMVSEFEHLTDGTLDASALFWGFEDVAFDRIVLKSMAADGKSIGIDNLQIAVNTVPEPSTVLLLGAGMAAVLVARRRRAK